MLRRRDSVESVEDSEPEREMIRQQRKQAKTRTYSPYFLQPSVIELSDDDDGEDGQISTVTRGKHLTVIEISDESGLDIVPSDSTHLTGPEDCSEDSLTSRILCTGLTALHTTVPSTSAKASLDEPRVKAATLPPELPEDEDDPIKALKLTKFAFDPVGKKSAPSKLAQPRQIYTSATQSDDMPKSEGKGKASRPAPHRFAEHFTDAELSDLSKCVGCDMKWTTRKTVAHKMLHIHSCAKKKAFTDETVYTLIRTELAKPKSTKQATKELPPATQTMFTALVDDAQTKRRTKRPKVVESVRPLSDTREDILFKAKSIIGPLPNVSGSSDDLPRTQPLVPSILGQRNTNAMSLFNYESPGKSNNEPLSEPQPSQSKLFSPCSSSANDPSLRPDSTPVRTDVHMSLEEDGDVPDYTHHDDAYLHYEPEHVGNDVLTNIEDDMRAMQIDDSPVNNAKRKGKSKATGKTRKKDIEPTLDEIWERELKKKILSDSALHHRILRYEPIHIDKFLPLAAEGCEKPSGKLMTKLKAFLDKQAINFYGSELTSRTRR